MNIEKAKSKDVEEISKIRIQAIKKLNSQDHTSQEMEYLLDRQIPEALLKKINQREFYVATENGKIKEIGNSKMVIEKYRGV